MFSLSFGDPRAIPAKIQNGTKDPNLDVGLGAVTLDGGMEWTDPTETDEGTAKNMKPPSAYS